MRSRASISSKTDKTGTIPKKSCAFCAGRSRIILHKVAAHFIGNDTAVMVMDILYRNGTFRPLTEGEKIIANLLVFCDVLPG